MRRAVIVSPSDGDALAHANARADAREDAITGADRFARTARIPVAEGFDACLKRASIYRNGAFAFHVLFSDAPGWRLGLVIPKRQVRSAVARNAIKRRWREAFRRRHEAWATEFGGADLVIRMHTAPPSRPAFDAGAILTTLSERLRSRGVSGRALPRGTN